MADTSRIDLLAEQLVLLYSGGDPSEDSTLDIREARLLVEQVYSNLIRQNYFENLKAAGQHSVNGAFKSVFVNLPILRDVERQEYYTVLPKAYISLPHNKGLDAVWEYGKAEPHYARIVRSGFNSLFKGLRAARLENQFGCYPEGNKIIYVNETGRHFTWKFANIRLVYANPESMAPDQDLTILAECTKMLSARRPQDKQNDGNPVTT